MWTAYGASRRVPKRGEETPFPERFFSPRTTTGNRKRIAARSKNHRITFHVLGQSGFSPREMQRRDGFQTGRAEKNPAASCHAIGPVRNHTLLPAIFFRVKAPDPLGLQTNNIVSDPIAPRSSWQIKKEKRDCSRVRDDLSFGCCCFKPEMRHNFVTGSLFRIVPRSGHSQAPRAAAAC